MKNKICFICNGTELIFLHKKIYCKRCKIYFENNTIISENHNQDVILCEKCTLPKETIVCKDYLNFIFHIKKSICLDDYNRNNEYFMFYYHKNKQKIRKRPLNIIFLILIIIQYFVENKLLYLMLLFYFDVIEGFSILTGILKLIYYFLELNEILILSFIYIFMFFKGATYYKIDFIGQKLEKDLDEISGKLEKIKI